MSAHTPGPWKPIESRDGLTRGLRGWHGPESVNVINWNGISRPMTEVGQANARLIAAAPAMDIALRLISEGHARIDKYGSLREFCFEGIRYSMNGDWNGLMDVIGWDKAIAKATGDTP